MAKVILNKNRRKAERIIRCLPRNIEVAEALGNSQQKQLYRTEHVYPEVIAELITVLDLAGYEIREKDEL